MKFQFPFTKFTSVTELSKRNMLVMFDQKKDYIPNFSLDIDYQRVQVIPMTMIFATQVQFFKSMSLIFFSNQNYSYVQTRMRGPTLGEVIYFNTQNLPILKSRLGTCPLRACSKGLSH